MCEKTYIYSIYGDPPGAIGGMGGLPIKKGPSGKPGFLLKHTRCHPTSAAHLKKFSGFLYIVRTRQCVAVRFSPVIPSSLYSNCLPHSMGKFLQKLGSAMLLAYSI